MIQFDHVNFSYTGGQPVLQDLSFHIGEGEQVGLIGANGAGKSTLMKAVLGLVYPQQGRVLADGIPVEPANLPQIRKSIGYVLQDSDQQMFMPTVLDDMIFGPVNYGMQKAEAVKKAEEALESLHIEYLKDRYNHRISGGEKRMAAIATILTMDPKVMLMDEPSSSLDPRNRRNLIRALKTIPVTKLIAAHDLDLILDTCTRVLLLSGGRIAADGPAEEILRDKKLLEENGLELPLSIGGRSGQ